MPFLKAGLESIIHHSCIAVDLPKWTVQVLAVWLLGIVMGYCLALLHVRLQRGREAPDQHSQDKDNIDCSDDNNVPEIAENWIVSPKDLAFFQRHLGEGRDGEQAAAHTGGPWELMMKKEIPGVVRYIAWRRSLRNGSTEYKSITLSGGVSAKEFMDFYLDDEYRPRWDTMLHHTQILENVDPVNRKQVTLWRRNFPFNFVSEREYVIARCMFREDKDLYAVTKSVGEDYEHPLLDVNEDRNVVRVDSYYSMWRSRDIPNPWDPNAPACETVLLHHDDLKVPEHLARLTIKLGMWGFVKNISQQVQPFVQARRQRCGIHEDDPAAFGVQPLDLEGTPQEPSTVIVDTTVPTSPTAAAALKLPRQSKLMIPEPFCKTKDKQWSEGWAKGLQRAAWMVVGLTLVRLLMLNTNSRPMHHGYSRRRDEQDYRRVEGGGNVGSKQAAERAPGTAERETGIAERELGTADGDGEKKKFVSRGGLNERVNGSSTGEVSRTAVDRIGTGDVAASAVGKRRYHMDAHAPVVETAVMSHELSDFW